MQEEEMSALSSYSRRGDVAELEVGAPAIGGIESIEQHGAVDPDLLGARVHAERIARPKDDVRVLASDKRANLVIKPDGPSGVDRQPLDGVVFSNVDADCLAGGHGLRRLLIETL